jgi:hypothetical protein
MECDICSGSPQGAKQVSAETLRKAVNAGYTPFAAGHPGNLGALSAALGLSREQAFNDWRSRVMRDSSAWLVCPLCQEKMDPYLTGATPSKCFIATACYSPNAQEVLDLRTFRDEILATLTGGRQFIRIYEAMSPPFANYLLRHPAVSRAVRRLVLTPLVWCIRAIKR